MDNSPKPTSDLREIAKRYAADLRLWTTQETVEANLIRACEEAMELQAAESDRILKLMENELQQLRHRVKELEECISTKSGLLDAEITRREQAEADYLELKRGMWSRLNKAEADRDKAKMREFEVTANFTAENDRLRDDTERLDWLEKNPYGGVDRDGCGWFYYDGHKRRETSLRAAIDRARNK